MDLPNFILFEHATGYGLFKVNEFDQISKILPQVEAGTIEKGKFFTMVQLKAFLPFKSSANALENCNSISEGILSPDLVNFLETNIAQQKKDKPILGVGDSKIGQAISETFSHLRCVHVGPVAELLRLIRWHFSTATQGLSGVTDEGMSQLGLGHSYSRAKVKFNVHRVDNMIIQAIALLDQLDKDINTFSMRIREWYSYHFPELYKIVPDQYTYCRCAKLIRDRKTLTQEQTPALIEIVQDEEKVKDIFEAVRSSMGMDISPIDLINIERFTDRVVSLSDYRKELQDYLRDRMHSCAPSLATLIGEQVGARLISKAGSLTNLAKYPASTIQILGAEKALFRALKTRGATPKYGLLFHSTFIGRAAAKNKGRISRYLANKCALASRIDCFSEIPVETFGEFLKQQVEDRLKFFESGEIPKKNIEVMKEAMVAAATEESKIVKKRKKQMKKQKKEAEAAAAEQHEVEEAVSVPVVVKENGVHEDDAKAEKRRRKAEKRKLAELAQENGNENQEIPSNVAVAEEFQEGIAKKKKKKKDKLVNGE